MLFNLLCSIQKNGPSVPYVPSAPAVATISASEAGHLSFKHQTQSTGTTTETGKFPQELEKCIEEPVMMGQTYVTNLFMVPGRSEASQSPFPNVT